MTCHWKFIKKKEKKRKESASDNMTSRECSGDIRRLVGVPQAAAEAPEGYLNGWLIPLRSVGSKH